MLFSYHITKTYYFWFTLIIVFMRKSNFIFLLFSKVLAFKLRLILRIRYRIKLKGAEVINKNATILYLPNHQALIDPIILFSEIYRFSTATPVISEKYYDIPVARWLFSKMGAVRVSDLEAGSRDTQVLKSITRSVFKGLRRNTNIVIYPSGQIAAQGFEKIFNKKAAYHIVNDLPENVLIAGVRISGLWGSRFSKFKTGKSPNFIVQLLQGGLFALANLFVLMPKRNVLIEFEDITAGARKIAADGQKPLNTYLEEFYNLHGEQTAARPKYFFFLPGH